MLPSAIHLDDSLWPLLTVRYVGSPTCAQVEEFLALRVRYFERETPHVLLHDFRTMTGRTLSAEHRRVLVSWMRTHEADMQRLTLGAALLLDSVVVRLLVSVLLHLKPARVPHLVVPDLSTGMHWCASLLRQSGREADAQHLLGHSGLLDGWAPSSGECGEPPRRAPGRITC